jgi:hypothetical protein
MTETRDQSPLTIYFRPCRVCGGLIGCLREDATPICPECDAKPEPMCLTQSQQRIMDRARRRSLRIIA